MEFGNSATENGSVSGSVSRKTLSVLIVDDDPIIRRINTALLNRFGLEVNVAENGKEAIDLYSAGAYFDIVFMDMEMPIMDGPMATRELRNMGVTSTIVGLTSRSLDSEIQEFMAAGLNGCYVKPLTNAKITSMLQEHIASTC